MKIVGPVAELTRREARLFGCERIEPIGNLDLNRALGWLAARQERFENRPEADSLGAYVHYLEGKHLSRDEDTVYGVAGMVLAHELEAGLKTSHEPTPEV